MISLHMIEFQIRIRPTRKGLLSRGLEPFPLKLCDQIDKSVTAKLNGVRDKLDLETKPSLASN